MSASLEHSDELFNELEYIRRNNIHGDFVECGVWKGGIILGIMEYLYYHNMMDRRVWLYDTFNGLTEPTEEDYEINGSHISTRRQWEQQRVNETTNQWCLSTLDEVKNNLSKSNFPKENVVYVVGDICETLKLQQNIPNEICLLRLDTDWYESTKMEMDVLYPKVVCNGVVIVDDYNYWNGSRKAIDESVDYKKHTNRNSNKKGRPLIFHKD
jgi:O-methyltransferase